MGDVIRSTAGQLPIVTVNIFIEDLYSVYLK